jgi:hypothetical protein
MIDWLSAPARSAALRKELAMIHREGRLATVQAGSGRQANRAPPKTIVGIRSWERPLLTAALVAALVLGGIAGLKSLVGLIP